MGTQRVPRQEQVRRVRKGGDQWRVEWRWVLPSPPLSFDHTHVFSPGLLVGACVNRAPEGTFGAAVAEVGVLDLLKFADFTIGKAWCGDYGDPHDPKDFDFIYPISPLHNVPTDRVLPPTILLTADRAWTCSF